VCQDLGKPLHVHSSSCGRKISKTFTRSYMGDQVWLITSRHTAPFVGHTLGWYILFTNPIDGLLYGYSSGSSTFTRQSPFAYGE
jgi:hypothetical protein